MNRTGRVVVAWAFSLGIFVAEAPSTDAREDPGGSRADALAGLAGRVIGVTDVVLANHLDPPTRQQMLLAGLREVYKAAGVPTPESLAKRVSDILTTEQLAALLHEVWPRRGGAPEESPALEEALLDGLLGSVPGRGRLVSDKELKVEKQLDANLYVGVHVQLGYDREVKKPSFMGVFEGGPADRAGIRKGELLDAIDDTPTEGRPLSEVVDRLRGPEGTQVVIRVLDPKSKASRSLALTRGLLPQPTLTGVAKRSSGGWEFLVNDDRPVGYVHFERVAGSTPQELRTLAKQLEDNGVRALILDFRETREWALHPTVLLADGLLGEGTIGRVRWAGRVETFRAGAERLFDGWRLAVLVDQTTPGEAAWLAAALQDNGRAVVVGLPTVADGFVQTSVPVAAGGWSVVLKTGRLERADGRLIGDPLEMKAELALASRRAGAPPNSQVPSPTPVIRLTPGGSRLEAAQGVEPDVQVVKQTNQSRHRSKEATGPAALAVALADPVVIAALEHLRKQ
jgi:carboxyl-terminal processing protease